MSRKSITFLSAAALTLAASVVSADNSSPFPYSPLENGIDRSYVGVTYADLYRADVARADGSSFPWTVNESGFDGAYVRTAPADLDRADVARAVGSAFPWTVNESGPYVFAEPVSGGTSAVARAPAKGAGGRL